MPTYLISGTTRGIGRALVASLLLRPETTIFAGVRDGNASSARSLTTLSTHPSSRIFLIQLDATKHTDTHAVLDNHQIHSLDIVIANAGVYSEFANIPSTSYEAIREHFEINTLGVLSLLQATAPLLEKSLLGGRFVVTTSLVGSATIAAELSDVPAVAYGISKAAVNWLVRKAVGEFNKVRFLSLHPGLVATDMGDEFVKSLPNWTPISVERSLKGYLEVLDRPVAETSGKFLDFEGNELPW